MRDALARVLGEQLTGADALVMAAAVADYRMADIAAHKLKRDQEHVNWSLVKNPDLLAEIGQKRKNPTPVLVGFAVETADDEMLVKLARDKLNRKRVDVVVANHASDSLGRDDNRVWLVTATAAELVSTAPKAFVAEAVLDHLARQLAKVATC
jgi:phosphopantothenoylcysteine decarboxylase/phosphopantothenate--cysteine ligase